MIEPLMLLLSSINQDFTYDHPVDILYLNRSDRTLILQEADRLGKLVINHDKIMMGVDAFGNPIVDDAQLIGMEKLVKISLATQMILTRLQECYRVLVKWNASATQEEDAGDLGVDSIILRLEGNPKFVYIYVYNTMESKGVEYSAKVAKLAEVYNTIIGHTQVSIGEEKLQFLMKRLELQSTLQFWERLLTADAMMHFGGDIAPITAKDLQVAVKELRDLGFYGFVNPYKMYTEFAGSRINRKLDINVSDEVTNFLRKVVLSGGGSVL